MNIEDLLIPAPKIATEKWQLGAMIKPEIREGGIALIFCSDERGSGGTATPKNFTEVRKQLYQLSRHDWEIPIADLGDFISGKTPENTHFALQELLTYCLRKHVLPIVVGGSNDISYSLFSAINHIYKNLTYVQINNMLSLDHSEESLTEKNFLAKILSSEINPVGKYHHLGFQKHSNEYDAVKLMNEVNFDIIRLAEMMNSTEPIEPYFRKADLVTISCNAIESIAEPFSVQPQVNGLNRREICAYMKEAGLSENLKSIGIFNYQTVSKNYLNQQLLAQMIWYLLEGINIQRSHPKEREYETFWIMIGDHEVAFKRDTFSNLWYFGKSPNISECLPCAKSDFENAKAGHLNSRLLRFEE
ncbi:formimidoylglutamase [Elizabethkingia anophelis]|uniref:Arginase n=1 Tax=Elizabethkingia anophelis TaxID=1117645 RepID=A0AAE4NZZ7_9FLAO|nr:MULTISPECIES: formimidoylglutamase [Elizabethkingia]AKH96510.1 Arginase/agmatinase/formiminoglutamase [Elizabethkingia anophelis FMS-007]KUF46801.1 arginase [Elizabethkingia anophelis]MCT3643369.1 formimidoylglutamase [Elizabethkingia anophelis]MCT3649136.1 formimidoylglutamase [Elizabethkingia anophelis]MCT3653066.1 formimidoylglutamase [Elizabethkingia anophelis]